MPRVVWTGDGRKQPGDRSGSPGCYNFPQDDNRRNGRRPETTLPNAPEPLCDTAGFKRLAINQDAWCMTLRSGAQPATLSRSRFPRRFVILGHRAENPKTSENREASSAHWMLGTGPEHDESDASEDPIWKRRVPARRCSKRLSSTLIRIARRTITL